MNNDECHNVNLPGEVWKDISGFEGKYQVSNRGRVKSLKFGRWGTHPRILKTSLIVKGRYKIVSLFDGNTCVKKYVHILVAEAFLEKPSGSWVVNHIDGDGTNNDVTNLEWVTFQQNIMHSIYVLGKRNDPVICTETGIIYPSMAVAASAVGCLSADISAACKTGRPFRGTHWVKISKKDYYDIKLRYEEPNF